MIVAALAFGAVAVLIAATAPKPAPRRVALLTIRCGGSTLGVRYACR